MPTIIPGYGAVPNTSYANVYISTAGSGSTSGSTSGTGYTWTGTSPSYDTGVLKVNGSPPSIQITGDAEIFGNLKWRDRDMDKWIESVESRLAMLKPNPKLEAEFDQLKALGDQYRALEKEILEKQKVWDILKKS